MSCITSRHFEWLTRTALMVLVIAGSLSLAGCDDDDEITSPETPEGTYVLVSINGGNLPFTLPNTGSDVIEVESADLVIEDNGTYVGSVQGEENGVAGELFADAGTTSVTGTTVTFTSSNIPNLTYSGTLNGDQLTFAIPGAALGSSGTLTLTFER